MSALTIWECIAVGCAFTLLGAQWVDDWRMRRRHSMY